MARINLRPGDSLRWEELEIVVLTGQVELSYSFTDGDQAWCEELTAGQFTLTRGQPKPKLDGD